MNNLTQSLRIVIPEIRAHLFNVRHQIGRSRDMGYSRHLRDAHARDAARVIHDEIERMLHIIKWHSDGRLVFLIKGILSFDDDLRPIEKEILTLIFRHKDGRPLRRQVVHASKGWRRPRPTAEDILKGEGKRLPLDAMLLNAEDLVNLVEEHISITDPDHHL